ncbi:MAG TPA: calcium-binding protein, partial [Longimicrobium sp.]|uniref:calcium-binding protein n=1 Tax=Longimicrobium sp. TaxID=2029185 RepID=UPI002EDBB70F
LEGNDTIYAAAGADTLEGGAGDDNLQGQDGNDLLKAGIGNDSLSGGNGADDLQGEAGNDYLYGDAGNDVFDGGAGNDYLSGGSGADLYRFGRGYGAETVYNHDGDAVGVNADTVSFAADVLPADVTVRRSGEDLVLSIAGTTDSLRVQSYFSQDGASQYAVENIQFADGTVWNVAAVKSMVTVPTAGNDTLYGYATDDVLTGLEGNDTIYAAAGADTLEGGAGDDNLQGQDGNDLLLGGIGGDGLSGGNGADDLRGEAGNDYLYGDAGNDVFDGGAGNDYLSGGNGADTYRFGRGYGTETVYNHDSDAVGVNADAVQFAADVSSSDVTLTRTGDDLVATINGTTDSLRIQYYFSSNGASPYAVESLRFADGTAWDVAAVKAKVAAGGTTTTSTTSGTTFLSSGPNIAVAAPERLAGHPGHPHGGGTAAPATPPRTPPVGVALEGPAGQQGDSLATAVGSLGGTPAVTRTAAGGIGSTLAGGATAGNDLRAEVARLAGASTTRDSGSAGVLAGLRGLQSPAPGTAASPARPADTLAGALTGTAVASGTLSGQADTLLGALQGAATGSQAGAAHPVDTQLASLVSAMAAFAPTAAAETALPQSYFESLHGMVAASLK